MHIADPRHPQLRAQNLLVELRVVSRTRDTAHIDDAFNTMCSQNLKKLFPRARRMPNREDNAHLDLGLSHNDDPIETFDPGATSI